VIKGEIDGCGAKSGGRSDITNVSSQKEILRLLGKKKKRQMIGGVVEKSTREKREREV